MKNYGDRGGCYPSKPWAEADNTLPELHNSSYDTKAEFNRYQKVHNNNNVNNNDNGLMSAYLRKWLFI